MKVNEVCSLTGLTKKAIDYYEQKKIISPKIMENGYREFSEIEIERLERVAVFRALGLSVNDIKDILNSKFPKEELRKFVIKKSLENELSNKQTQLLEKLSKDEDIQGIKKEIDELNKNKSIKEEILEMFPGFYGRFLVNHFNRFLEEPINTDEQKIAYKTIIKFLDNVEAINLSDEIMNEFEEAMDFWTEEKLEEVELQKRKNIENPEEFIKEQSKMIEEYQAFKESEEYEESSFGKIMGAMKMFGMTSGYNDIFIPAMRKLSLSYEKYYKELLEANEIFIKRYPNFK